MSEGINTDKVIVNAGGGSPQGYDNGGDHAALVAAILGNRQPQNDGLMGGGGLGGILIGALLGGGLFGNRGRDGERGFGGECAQKSDILMNKLGDIQASVPLAEAQVQLALAGVQNGLSSLAQTNVLKVLDGQTQLMQGQNATNVALLAGFNGVQREICEAKSALSSQIGTEGDRTRALINDINREDLNRQLAVAQGALVEERSFRRTRDSEVNVTQTVNQNQAQAQAQAQVQGLVHGFNRLSDRFDILNQDNQYIRNVQKTVSFGGAATSNNANTQTQV